MPRKLTYNVFHDDNPEPVYTTGHRDDALKWCRATYGRRERAELVITYHNPFAKGHLDTHAGCVRLPSDFEPIEPANTS
jgi:hypothetical protein